MGPPTIEEVESVMCQTDAFFERQIQNAFTDDTIDSYGTFIIWRFEAGKVTVQFLSNTTISNGSPVPPLFITSAMNVAPSMVEDFVADYVLNATLPEGNVFLDTTSVVITNRIYEREPLSTELVRATCPYTVPETGSPTVAVTQEGQTSSPTSMVVSTNGTTMAPSVAPGGTTEPSPTETNDTITLSPTAVIDGSTATPTITFAPTPPPTEVGGAGNGTSSPTETPALSTGVYFVEADFIVSNLEGIGTPREILGLGLLTSWRVFAQDIVENTTVFENPEGRRFLLQDFQRRRLSVEYVMNSAQIMKLDEMRRCPEGSHPDAWCHDATGRFEYEIVEENLVLVNETYTNQTNEAIRDGTYQVYVEDASPGTPLIIGIIPPDESETTVAPSGVSGDSPTTAPGNQGGVGGGRPTQSIELAFIVSNLDGIRDPDEIRAEGLDASWPVFVESTVKSIASSSSASRRRRLASPRRFLEVTYEAESAEILEVTEEPCEGNVRKGSICHVALGTYTVVLEEGSDAADLEELYKDGTEVAVYDGTYYDILQEVDPGSPLYFGTLNPLPPAILLRINFGEDATREPADSEIDRMICNVHDWVEELLMAELDGSETDTLMSDLAWTHTSDAGETNRFQLQFAADSTYAETGELVPPDLIVAALTNLNSADNARLLQGIKDVPFFDVFNKAEVLIVLEASEDLPSPLGELNELVCPLVTPAPTISPAPTQSPMPSMVPTISSMPSTSLRPSISPSLSLSPSAAPSERPVETFPTAPVVSPAEFPSTGIFPIRTEFRVSNLDGITSPFKVRSEGIEISWRVYAFEIVQNITVFPEPGAISRRRLSVVFVPGSAIVTDLREVPCDENSHKDAVCHDAKAEYKYEITDEILLIANDTYTEATDEGRYNGTYQFILDREEFGTPLVIGTILPNGEVVPPTGGGGKLDTVADRGGDDESDNDKMAGWAIFLIILLILICLALLAWLFFFLRDKEDDTPPYHEEDFAYDFFIPKDVKVQTEVDDIVNKNASIAEEDAGSTASSGSNAMEPFGVEASEEVDIEEEEWEASDGDEWEDEDQENRGLGGTDSLLLLKNVDSSGIGEGEYAKEAHRLLLESSSSSFRLDGPVTAQPLPFSDTSMPEDPPQRALPDPTGGVVPTEIQMDDMDDVWDDEDAAGGAHQPTYDEITGSDDAWSDLQAAVTTQESEVGQNVADYAGEHPQTNAEHPENDNTADSEGWDEETEETDGGWDDVDDTSSHSDDPDDRWA